MEGRGMPPAPHLPERRTMAKKSNEENKAMIVALLEELRHAQTYGLDNEQRIKDDLTRLGYTAEKPSKRAEKRPSPTGGVESR